MSSLQVRRGIIYAQLNIQIEETLKTRAKELEINLTEVCVAAIRTEINRIETQSR